MCSRKLRDLADFEWQRFLRFYALPTTEGIQLVLRCLDCELAYQCDFLGVQSPPVFTPRSDAWIISFTQASIVTPPSLLVPRCGLLLSLLQASWYQDVGYYCHSSKPLGTKMWVIILMKMLCHFLHIQGNESPTWKLHCWS